MSGDRWFPSMKRREAEGRMSDRKYELRLFCIVLGFVSVSVSFPCLSYAQEVSEEETTEPESVEEDDESWPCLGRPGSRVIDRQLVAGQYNPLGIVHVNRIGVCVPFVRDRGILFDLSAIELGILTDITPSSFQGGGYFKFAPLSILSLSAEFVGLAYYKFPMKRAGYFPVDDYDNSGGNEFLPDDAGYAGGWRVGLTATLQAAIPLGGRLSLVIVDVFNYDFWHVGEEPFYINLAEDFMMARSDHIIANEGILLLQIDLRSDLKLRIGAYDTFRYVPQSEQRLNVVGGMALLTWAELGRRRRLLNMTPFIRLGAYTHHEDRQGEFTGVLGLSLNFDILQLASNQ